MRLTFLFAFAFSLAFAIVSCRKEYSDEGRINPEPVFQDSLPVNYPGEGHAMVIIGYDDSRGSLRLLNSWSRAWADSGEAWIDYNFFLQNAEEDGYVFN
jgi:C1A family cysteine protease